MPVGNDASRAVDRLAKVLQRREAEAKQFPDLLVTGRNADGTIQVRDLRGECVATSNICSAYKGQQIQIPCGVPFRITGAAGIAMQRAQRQSGTLWVESYTPNEYHPGESYEVTVTGKGFKSTTQFEYLLPDSEDVNEDITIDEIAYVSATEMTLSITVAEDADLLALNTGGLAYDNPGMPS